MKRYFFIVNFSSSKGSNLKYWKRIQPLLQEAFPDMEFAITQAPGHGVVLSKEAIREGFNRIIAVGGDGTNCEVANGFFSSDQELKSKSALGFIPAGTGNDFCRTIGMPKKIEEIIRVLQKDKLVLSDLGLLSCSDNKGQKIDKVFVNEASFGLSSLVVHAIASSSKFFGATGIYALGALKAASKYKNQSLTIKAFRGNECVLDIKDSACFTIVAGNGQYFGGGLRVAPNAVIDDGMLELVVMGDLSKSEFLLNFPKVYFGRHQNHSKVTIERIQRLEANASELVLVELDGEKIGRLPLEINVLHQALQLILP